MDKTVKIDPDDAFRAMAVVQRNRDESGKLPEITMNQVAHMAFVRFEVKSGRMSG